jgi:fibronectin type 3 domain-containing protein
MPLSVCSAGEYENVAPTSTSDRECRSLTTCGDDEYESASPTPTQDRICTSRQAAPGWIEAEDYGVDEAGLYYHDASPGNDGGAYRNDDVDIYAFGQEFFVSMQSSEWLRYPLSVAQSGTYRLRVLAYADEPGRHLNFYVDDEAVALRAPVQTSGEDIVVDAVYLDAGAHVLQISGGIHDDVVLDAFKLSLLDCPDMDGDGQCDENDCRPLDAECFQGVCCRDLVGHWTFDEVLPERALDSSDYENHGSFTTSPLYIDGVLGNAMYFSGGEVIEIPNNDSLEVEKNYSFSAWVSVVDSPAGKLLRLQNKTNAWVYLGENRFQARAANTGSSSWPDYRTRSSRPLTAQTWQHVAAVVDDTQVRLYIDGRLDVVKTIKNYGLADIGKGLKLAEGFVGALDDVRLYAETLSDDDIAELLMMVPGSETACSDGIDNDNNAKKDFGLEPNCDSFFDDDESTDLTPPDTPINLSVVKETPIIVHLAWDKSDDALAGYHVYRDGRRVDTVMRPAFYDTKLVEGAHYRYAITAIDAMGNESPLSQEVGAYVPHWPTRTPGETLVVSTTDFHGHGSLKALVASSPEDTIFVLEPGVYRLASEIRPKTGQSLIGQPGAILSGAIELDVDDLENEIVGNNTLYKWPNLNIRHEADVPGSCVWNKNEDPLIDKDRCLYTHDLFLNDVVLTRVMTKEEVTQGTFYTDYDGNSGNASVYFWDNPEGQKIELSKTRNAIMGGPISDCFDEATQVSSCHDHVTIKGLMIEKFATVAQRGAIQPRRYNSAGDLGRYWRVEQNEIRWNHGLGVRLGTHSRLLNNNIHHNGNSGAEVGKYNLVEGNTFSGHNYAKYNKSWNAGAFKIVGTEYTLIRGNHAHDNDGHGLWTDIANIHVIYENNISVGNNGDGFKHEISNACVMRNNRSFNNYNKEGNSWLWGAGILIQNSDRCDVYNNHVEVGAQGNGITVIDQNRSFKFSNGITKTFHGVGNTIHRNKVVYSAGGRSGYQNADNVFDYNVYLAANPFANHFGLPFHRFQERGYELSGAIFALKEKKSLGALEPALSVAWVSEEEIFNVAGDSLLELEVRASVVGDDAITGVAFFVDDKLHARISHPPYVMRWFYPQEGSHQIRAVVSTMHGESGKTAVKNLQITD